MTSASPSELTRAVRHLEGAAGRALLGVACEAAGVDLRGSVLRSVHHRPRRSVSHVHAATLAAGDTEREVLLVAHVDRRRYPDGAFLLESDGVTVAVWRFPQDPYLPGLPSAVSPERVRELLDDIGAPEGDVTLLTRAYRPSRRAVVEVHIAGNDVEGRILYLKVLAGDRAEELADVHRRLAGYVPVPRVIGVAAAQGILGLEALEGRTLRQALVEDAAIPEPGALVELTRRFAASGLESRRDPRGFADPVRHVAPLVALVPDRADDLVRVAEQASDLRGELVAVHGDLHDGQLLLADDGVVTGLLDVDGSGRGLLAHDAGNLIAHVQVIGEIWPEVATRVEDYAAELTEAFRPVVGPEALSRATAGAWIGLATGPHRAQDADWPERTRSRIDRAVAAIG